MKINYQTKSKRINVELQANSPKDAFKQLAEFQEVFDEQHCGSCGSDHIKFQVRTVEGNDYYEMRCNSCFAKLAFGQHKVGDGLFPKRKNDDGKYDNETKGWKRWQPSQT